MTLSGKCLLCSATAKGRSLSSSRRRDATDDPSRLGLSGVPESMLGTLLSDTDLREVWERNQQRALARYESWLPHGGVPPCQHPRAVKREPLRGLAGRDIDLEPHPAGM